MSCKNAQLTENGYHPHIIHRYEQVAPYGSSVEKHDETAQVSSPKDLAPHSTHLRAYIHRLARQPISFAR